MKNIAIVCNPEAHKVKANSIADHIAKKLETKNISYTIFLENWPQNFDGFTEVWVIGGDGTINYFINKYPDLKLPIALFKGGTGNDFHWIIYKDLTLDQQIEQVLNGTVFKVDGGLCNGKLFLNGVGVGFDGAIIRDLTGKKKRPGKTSYMISVLKNIFFYRENYCEVHASGSSFKGDAFMISVANAPRYGGGFKVAPSAVVNDGLLDVNIVSKVSVFKRLRYLPVIEKGRHLDYNLDFITYWQKDKVTIKSNKILGGQRDGEYIEGDYFEIEILPGRFEFIY